MTLSLNTSGVDPAHPYAPKEGMLSIQGKQIRFWADLSDPPDGDYDADMASWSNMYLVAGASMHLMPGKVYGDPDATPPVPAVEVPGRIVLRGNNVANYLTSGGNYSGTWYKDLIITRYGFSDPWMIFDESHGGWCGVGTLFTPATEVVNGISRELYQVNARFHVIDSASRVALIESTATSARLAFRDSTTIGASTEEPMIGSAANELYFQTDNTPRARIGSTGLYPSTDNSIPIGKSSRRWSVIWSATGTISTSDERDKNIEAAFSGSDALTMLDEIEPQLYKWKVGHVETTIVPDGTEELEIEEGKTETVPKTKEVYTEIPGERLHAGFIAQNVKAAMDQVGIDFGAWGLDNKDDPNSSQFIRSDQLVAVLWAAVRELRSEVTALKNTR